MRDKVAIDNGRPRVPSIRGYIDHVKTSEGPARLWTVLGGVAAATGLPLAVVLAIVFSGSNSSAPSGAITTSSPPTPSPSVPQPSLGQQSADSTAKV
jgi:hypothetical protein